MDLTGDPRAAGEIRRYHTWAIHNEQSVGEHTWQVMRIILTVWPSCPRHVLVYTVKHDMGEMAGDIPYPFKIRVPELRAGMDKAENMVDKLQREGLGAPLLKHPLTPFERLAFKLCENLEMWEHGWREYNMGNRYALLITERMQAAVATNIELLEEMKENKEYRDHAGLLPAVKLYMRLRTQMESDLAER
jgi:5'-deoxynucleotidase YfbR-like HD superfamily hydrolase